jgi:hypothetical protein
MPKEENEEEVKTLPADNQPSSGDPTPPEEPGGTSPVTKAVITLVIVLFLGATGAAGYFYKQLGEIKKNPNKVAQDQTNAVITAVGRLIVLPTDEQPTLATVADPSKLKDQPFFANAKQGDKVLIYTNARKAILYDPVANKIVEVAPVNIGTTPAPAPATAGASTTPSK